jgi:hypothetical protein
LLCVASMLQRCLPDRCVATRAALTTENVAVLLLCVFTSAGICVLSRCLTMNYSGVQTSCHNIFISNGMSMAYFIFWCVRKETLQNCACPPVSLSLSVQLLVATRKSLIYLRFCAHLECYSQNIYRS